jgi:hypothetical protein
MGLCVDIHTHIHTYTYIHTYMRTYIPTHIHTYIHTYLLFVFFTQYATVIESGRVGCAEHKEAWERRTIVKIFSRVSEI